jgi:hypothetical protein
MPSSTLSVMFGWAWVGGMMDMIWDDVLAIGSRLPGVQASTSYRTRTLKAGGKLVTRLRAEDESLVLHGVPPNERDVLIAAAPQVFHVTPHYEGYPVVLARLAPTKPERLWPFIVRRWREVASKRAVASFEAARAGSAAFSAGSFSTNESRCLRSSASPA